MLVNYSKKYWNYLKETVLFEKLYGGREEIYPVKPDIHIIAAAWESPNGDIFTGENHYKAVENAAQYEIQAKQALDSDQGFYEYLKDEGWKDGFCTSEEKFVSRQEALMLAKASRQLKKNKSMSPDRLDSYDVI